MLPPSTGSAGEAVSLANSDLSSMSKNERIKAESKGLFFVSDGRGNVHPFLDEIRLLTSGERPTISGEAKEISKFFGIYKQQARGAPDRRKKSSPDQAEQNPTLHSWPRGAGNGRIGE